MLRLGLIGKKLSHSFSPAYFQKKFDTAGIHAEYKAYELAEVTEFLSLFSEQGLDGLNVTMPYKEAVMPYLDKIDSKAAAIGAVNTINLEAGLLVGYNTDVVGFEQSVSSWLNINQESDFQALILGSGGASKTVTYVLTNHGISNRIVSRSKGDLLYTDLTADLMAQTRLVVNCTPLGTYPKVTERPDIPYDYLRSDYFLYDLIYNPEKTLFLTLGEAQGARIKNGAEMLVRQAEESWRIWNKKILTD